MLRSSGCPKERPEMPVGASLNKLCGLDLL